MFRKITGVGMGAQPVFSIIQAFLKGDKRLRVQGARGPAHAFLLHELSKASFSPAWVICPDEETASRLVSDLEAFSAEILPSKVIAIHLPEWNPTLFSPVSLSLRTRFDRLRAMEFLSHDSEKTPLLVVTTLSAALQFTLSPEKWRTGAGASTREEILEALRNLGYLQVESVEEQGTFSLRGDLLDVFPSHEDAPLRVEWFDQSIERIRVFDPESQRTLKEERTKLRLPPAREVLSNPSSLAGVRRAIKEISDDLGIHRKSRDPLLDSVQEGFSLPHRAEIWARELEEVGFCALDFGKSWDVFWVDLESSVENFKKLVEDAGRAREALVESGFPAPEPSRVWDLDRVSVLSAESRLILDPVRMDEAGSVFMESLPLEIPTNHDMDRIRELVGDWTSHGLRVVVCVGNSSDLDRAKWFLKTHAPEFHLADLSAGFRSEQDRLVLLTEAELFGKKKRASSGKAKSPKAKSTWAGLQSLGEIHEGDAIIHREHGIGVYRGLIRLESRGAGSSDFLHLEYSGGDKLYLPVYKLDSVQRYLGSGDSAPLDKLGGNLFQKKREKTREAIRRLAIDLVDLYSRRRLEEGERFPTRGDPEYEKFESEFPYEETPDQSKAIEDCLLDLESGKVMDRLVCGDVGYGKTEVAMRAAFAAVLNGKQVAVLAPTTILNQQHEQSFRERFRGFPFSIEAISRFKPARAQKEILQRVSEGKVDILLGTHRLLSKDVRFKDLGLLVVDEEHRFGVEHKEKMKAMRVKTHVLTLSATPIPRTLQFSLSGIRDISLIATPPVDRLPIRTFISSFDPDTLSAAIEKEIHRGGQTFVLHNRVETIYKFSEKIRELVPGVKIGIAHGRLPEKELESAMLAFYRGETQVLVCTTIIESGLDVPNANTLIVDRADTLGLAQLYQIRGRVGRSDQRAYAYLLIPSGKISEDGMKRLEVIQRFVDLGSGFQIANHDLEIRGGGNLLGPEQSGHIGAVGFEYYLEMLEEAVREIRSGKKDAQLASREPEIRVPFPAYLPDAYVESTEQRLKMYRKLSAAKTDEELQVLKDELVDRFGELPKPAENLLGVIRIKQILRLAGVESLTLGQKKLTLEIGPGNYLDIAKVLAKVKQSPEEVSFASDSKLVVSYQGEALPELCMRLESLLDQLRNSVIL